jgi:hypothetical protein
MQSIDPQNEAPHAQRETRLGKVGISGFGRLRNGNPPGDFRLAPRCGAKTRRSTSCLSPAMKNGRCRMHGGMSTGPQTYEGMKRARLAPLRTGMYSKAIVEHREDVRLAKLFAFQHLAQKGLYGRHTRLNKRR